jgi:tyrosine-specific transport protein
LCLLRRALPVVHVQGLLVAAAPGVDSSSLLEQGNWSAVPATLPVVALAFVYHNVVPVAVQALDADAGRVRTAICAGVAIPWLMFVSWEAAILGSQPPAAVADAAPVQQAAASTTQVQLQQQQLALDPAPAVQAAVSSSSSSGSSGAAAAAADPLAALQAGNPTVGPLIQGFSLLAIATSFIGFILGLTDFLADGLKLASRQAPLPYLLTLVPPFAVAVTNPNIFLAALDTAGD